MSQPLFVRPLTLPERNELRKLVRRGEDARVVRRAQMVLLSAQRQTPSQIGALWELTAQGVRKILHRFNLEGVSGLSDRPRRGRPRKTNARYVALLKEAVASDPREQGYAFGCWTLDRLREHLAKRTRVLLSAVHLSRLMAEHGIVYRRPKHGMTHLRDPQEYEDKKAFLKFVKKRPSSREPRLICSTSTSVKFISTRP